MIELFAIACSDAASIRSQREAAWRRWPLGHRPGGHVECGSVSRGVSLNVAGDEPLDRCVFDDAGLSLICRTDLLATGAAEAEMADYPARSLATLYKCCGDTFVNELHGSFAIILYDKVSGELKAWTDHFGAEKLAFTDQKAFFGVATDLRLLLPLFAVRPEIDPAALQQYLQYTCIPAPKTIFKGILRLQPGHQVSARHGSATHHYWDLSYREVQDRHERLWAADTLEVMRSAVSLNLSAVESSKVGCFLSGGTDSSSIAGLVSRMSGHHPASTFSIGFNDPRYNEIQYARLAATHNASEHHEYFVKPQDILSLLDKAVMAYDEPFGNSSIIPTYYCARLAAEHGKTHLLAGDGGDEIFGGNSRYVEDRIFQRYGAIPISLRRLLIEPAVRLANSYTRFQFFDRAAKYIRRSNVPAPDRLFSYSFLSSVRETELFTSGFLAAAKGHDPLEPARSHYASAPANSDLNRWLYLDLKITISDNDIRKVTVMSKLAGVRPRYPMLDPTLAEFTGAIPSGLKVRGSQLRYLFKKAMADILPHQIVTKSKHGFGLPYSVWVGEQPDLKEFTFDILGSARSKQRGYFRTDLLEWLWSQYESVHRMYYGDILWMFLMLELWHLNQHDASMTGMTDDFVAVSGR